MNMLMTNSIMNQHELIWKEKEVHRVNLIYCTYQNLKKMNKIHMKIINLQEKSRWIIKKYIKELKIMCDTLWLQRDINLSKFFNSFFTDVKLNKHQDVDCKLSSMFNELVNFSVMTIIKQLQKNRNRKTQEWRTQKCIEDQSQININNWMMKVYWLRVLSTFLRLEQLSETQLLAFSEEKDWKKRYVCFETDHLYNLKRVESLYKKHILKIIFKMNCIKIKAINKLINHVWNKNEKTVFCIMSSMNALIL